MNRLLLILILMLVGLIPAQAQSAALPESPTPHHFLDRTNTLIISSLALAVTGDALSTQKFISRGYPEMNPLMKQLVQSRTGAALGTAAGFGASVGVMDYLHRRGHHRLERVFGWTVVTVETGLTFWNYRLTSPSSRI